MSNHNARSLQGGGGQMLLISSSLWISVDLWSSLKIKSDLIKTHVVVSNPNALYLYYASATYKIS